MPWVFPQQPIRLVRQSPDVFRKLVIAAPEPWVGTVFHRSVQRPSRKSLRASSASASRRPTATSSSIWRSHRAPSNSANHFRNSASSSEESRRIASSISPIVLMLPSLLALTNGAQPAPNGWGHHPLPALGGRVHASLGKPASGSDLLRS